MTKFKPASRESISARVSICGERGLALGGQTFVPDPFSAYLEFHLAHAFPVVTSDGTAMHPQVVANSYRSLLNKVFNLGHIMVANDPMNNARDRILGTIVGVEFPDTPAGGWRVMSNRATAPGIRAVAVLHRQAEGVEDVLRSYRSQRVRWTVSMEQEFPVDSETMTVPVTSGFIVKRCADLEQFEKDTPDDLARLGWTYVPCVNAPNELMSCFDVNTTQCRPFNGSPCVLLFGGLDGSVQFKGTGLTPLGKEAEARVSQMLASGAVYVDGESGPDVAGLDSLTAPLLAGLRMGA